MQVLETADKDELNFILAHNNAATLLEVSAEKTIDALTSRSGRLRDLSTLSRHASKYVKGTPAIIGGAAKDSQQTGCKANHAICAIHNQDVLCRAILLDGFQKIGLRHRPLRQAYAHRILMHTHAEDLSELKSYLDDGPDYHTTFKLLYSDFQVTLLPLTDVKLRQLKLLQLLCPIVMPCYKHSKANMQTSRQVFLEGKEKSTLQKQGSDSIGDLMKSFKT